MTITTKLIRPFFAESDDPLDWIFPPGHTDTPPGETEGSDAQSSPSNPLSAEMLSQHNFNTRGDKGPPEAIVVRIEISDTGYGIRPKEMASHKLFCTFIPSFSWWSFTYVDLQLPSTRQSKVCSKVERELAWALPSFVRLSN